MLNSKTVIQGSMAKANAAKTQRFKNLGSYGKWTSK